MAPKSKEPLTAAKGGVAGWNATAESVWRRVLEATRSRVTGLLAVSLVELATGTTLASWCEQPGHDVVAAGALASAVLRHKLRMLRSYSPKVALEDMLLPVGSQLHMIRMVTQTQLLYVVADGTTTHFAAVRAFVSGPTGPDG